MKKTEKRMWVCSECGSIHVQTKVWVDLNSNSIDWSSGLDLEEYYCHDCENTGIELRVIPTTNGAVKVLGYQVQNDKGDIHPAMTNNLSLYSLDQANDMLLDDTEDTPGNWYLKAYYKGDIENPVLMYEGKNPRKNA